MKFLSNVFVAGARALRRIVALSIGAACLARMIPIAEAQTTDLVSAALKETRPLVDLRWRIEEVEQRDLRESAQAITLRGRFGFETGKVYATAFLAEGEALWPIDGRYNDTFNAETTRPVIADPRMHEINRLQLTNTSLPGTAIILGRQRIVLDDQRFVGDVGWRQNDQTFDALRLTNRSITNLTLDFTYLDQVNRVFGNESPVGRYTRDSYLINASYQMRWVTVVGFMYLLHLEQGPADSSRTTGFRFAGERKWRSLKMGYSGSWARQRESPTSPLDYQNDYYAAELTGTLNRFSLGAGIEVLDGNGVKGFATPLATLHKFQGWADKFLTTPPDGIADRYVQVSFTATRVQVFHAVSVMAVYHDFRAERNARDYGSETDIQLQAGWHQLRGTLKYADYRAQRFGTDTRKYWAQLEWVL